MFNKIAMFLLFFAVIGCDSSTSPTPTVLPTAVVSTVTNESTTSTSITEPTVVPSEPEPEPEPVPLPSPEPEPRPPESTPAPPAPPTTASCAHWKDITSGQAIENSGTVTVTACFAGVGAEMDGQIVHQAAGSLNSFIVQKKTYQFSCTEFADCITFVSNESDKLCSNGATYRAALNAVAPDGVLGSISFDIGC